jgi:hypothetical protein
MELLLEDWKLLLEAELGVVRRLVVRFVQAVLLRHSEC